MTGTFRAAAYMMIFVATIDQAIDKDGGHVGSHLKIMLASMVRLAALQGQPTKTKTSVC